MRFCSTKATFKRFIRPGCISVLYVDIWKLLDVISKLQRIIGLSKSLNTKMVALHEINVRFFGFRAVWGLLIVFMESFQAVEGVGAGEGIAISDVLLPAFGLPYAILLLLMVILSPKFLAVPNFFNAE